MRFQKTTWRSTQHSNEYRREGVGDLLPYGRSLLSRQAKPIDIDKETFKGLTGPFPAPAWLKVTTNHVDHEMGSRPRVTGHHHGPVESCSRQEAKVSGLAT